MTAGARLLSPLEGEEFGIREAKYSGGNLKKKRERERRLQAFFIHPSTCMSRQLSLPMNVADALQK